MNEKLLKASLALLFLAGTTGAAFAQSNRLSQGRIRPGLLKKTDEEKSIARKEFQTNYPLLAKQMSAHSHHSAFTNAGARILSIPGRKSYGTIHYAKSNVTLWADLANKEGWTEDDGGPYGYYTFSPVSPLDFTVLYETGDQNVAKNGVQISNGKLYGLNVDLTYLEYDYVDEYLATTDIETGETSVQPLDYSEYLKLAAVETAQASDGTVYGEFYSADGSSFEWGTVDYATMTRTTIAPATHTFVALGITKEGQLYGIATDGNLYKIDKATGTETLVGATGLTLATSDGKYYGQTGEIDPKDNTFYWAAYTSDGTGGLYEVNLQTGAATLIAEGANQLYGMIVPPAAAADGAPAEVTNADANFAGPSLSGTITFTAPSTTYSGEALTGNLTYTIKSNDSVLATGTTTAGAAVTANVTVPESGGYTFVVTTSNNIGESPKVKLTKWIGYDVPGIVDDLTATSDNGIVTVSWKAPSSGIHDGALGALTYDVYRINNGKNTKVASDLTETSYVDTIPPSQLTYYTYGVRAKSEGKQSVMATSKGVVAGEALEPDWTEEFNSNNNFRLFTVVDANKDGRTWRYSTSGRYAYSNYNSKTGNDDWLFTPPIHLASDRLYKITFKARNAYDNNHNTFEVTWGTGTTAASQTDTLLKTTTPGGTFQTYSFDIRPRKEGTYYIGFHDNTAVPNQCYIAIDSIVVENGALGIAPDSVTNLAVTAAAQGELSATISFNAPSVNINGGAIGQLDSFQISRDGEQIATLPSAAAGSTQTYIDNAVPSNGVHTYDVVAFIGNNFGQKATAKAYIGKDVPMTPQNLQFTDNTTNVIASWNPFGDVGSNGGYSNGSDVSVSFFSLREGSSGYVVGDSLVTSAEGGTSVTLQQNPDETTEVDGTTQTIYRVAARANGEIGNSGYVTAGTLVIGPSIKIPFKESFSGGNIENGFAWVLGNDQVNSNALAATWILNSQASSDDDGGSAEWHAYHESSIFGDDDYVITAGDEVTFGSPKITLQGSTNPKLYFSLYATANDPASLEVKIQTPDGVKHTAKTIDLSSTIDAGWTTQSVDLTPYIYQRYIIVNFNGVAKGASTYIGLDNINVFDQYEHNLAAINIKAPTSVKAGKTANVDVTVENYGAQPAENYSVVLYANDNPVDTVAVNKELGVLDKDTVSLTLPVAINQSDSIAVKAVVVFANDLKADDNTTQVKTVKVIPSEYPKIIDLSASVNDDEVNLSWSAPVAGMPENVTEDFENYDAFSTQLGDWKLVDGDKGLAGGLFQGLNYPGQGTAFAFDAFNPNAISPDFDIVDLNPGLAPLSGNQFAGAPYVINASTGSSSVAADNWLISPSLSGKKQTIKFYAFNVSSDNTTYKEKFDVLYSTTGKDTTDFVKIESGVADGTTDMGEGANWKEISVEIPEGAKYFAIHHNSDADNYLLFGIDDISYEKSAAGANDSIVGYNIYRDGNLIGTVKGNVVAFSDDNADSGLHVYNVTVIYQDPDGNTNESGFSNDATVTVVTGIDDITANTEGRYNVYTLDGKAVMLNSRTLSGLTRGVYIINDKKYIIR